MNDHTDFAHLGLVGRMRPVGYWMLSQHNAVVVYSLSGKRPNLLKRLVVRLFVGWSWVDEKR